jgi:hypothetical protein
MWVGLHRSKRKIKCVEGINGVFYLASHAMELWRPGESQCMSATYLSQSCTRAARGYVDANMTHKMHLVGMPGLDVSDIWPTGPSKKH